MFDKTVKELGNALRRKEFSSVELTQAFLDRSKSLNGKINAFITFDEEQTLAQARAADETLLKGEPTHLTGIPIAHKDIWCAKDWITTCGSRMLENFRSPYNAHIIKRFNDFGAVIQGKTNMDEFAMGSSNETSWFGAVKNPWDLNRVPGGSSGGSAAAVAAGMTPASTGTDTGGSIRQPAALCGISGLKPTYGLVSRYGMIAFASSLDQGGPMAKSAEDLAILLEAMAGFDAKDSTSVNNKQVDYASSINASVAGLKIGIPKEYFSDHIAPDIQKAIELALKEYQKLGAILVDVELPTSPLSVAAYYVIAPAEASSNLSRFDGVRYGYRAPEYGDLNDMYAKTRAQGFGAEVKRRILIGTYVLSHGYYDAYYIKAQKIRRLISQDFMRAFQTCDVIMSPTTPSTAFKLGEKASDPVQMYLSDTFTIAANLAGLPAMSIPCGFDQTNLPIGLQLIGNYFDEAKMLATAHQFQRVTDWHLKKPPLTTA
ncbi:MAG: Asp-tRNA(Asn)/Glu-tRNA(Gln) amidotransferase subunit GatA [Burkholderiales bacterium]|jgi:aspartyl-tRNA(Asn)/glutamyl-tRNA(Gln) amidotransferase subunit A|nr:Asp-tRNA(Asn)/Glu-tRNA(Gln) amidotransferase subunit GatA [Pseudomonadota bacterium]MDA1011184.1 Asp-tRNA(Asn)/Glu-tRNA(Gln) amidotransferase subunit GatA [Pseudomonadota bacterium]|tara:strand:- start:9748 stop:11208 length:1461 start_codon:yes stop_codon:yes gene_type:complete